MLKVNHFIESAIEKKNTIQYDNKEDMAENFFLLDEKHTTVLENEEVLDELLRRVSVFHDALENSKGIYDAFADAAKGGHYKMGNSKTQYVRGIAQGFISLLLFGNNEKKLEEINDAEYITDRISKLLCHGKHEKQRQIIAKLQSMMNKGYDHLKIHNLGLLNETKTPIKDMLYLFDRVKEGTLELKKLKHTESATLLYDMITIKRKYMDIMYLYYTTNDRCFGRLYGTEITYADFCTLIDKIILLLPRLYEIHDDEMQLMSKCMDIIHNDTPDKSEDKHIDMYIKKHIKKYMMMIKRPWSGADEKLIAKELSRQGGREIAYVVDGIEIESSFFLKNIQEYTRYKSLKYFDKYFGKADHDKIMKDKETVGAKGAYLDELQIFIDKLHAYRVKRHDFKFNKFYYPCQVPKYATVEVQYYTAWKETGTLDDIYFKNLYEEWKDKDIQIIARSSAVKSEDNEVNTGAGIYHSEVIQQNSYEAFCAAIIKVYMSCDEKIGIEYRKDNAIESEYMGVVIQEYIGEGISGHVNSIMPHRPELLEVSLVTEKGMKFVLNKDNLIDALFQHGSSAEDDIFHYKIDVKNFDIHRNDIGEETAYLISLLERYFRKPIQVEFIFEARQKKEDERSYRYNKEKKIHVVQVRPLPKGLEEKYTVEFPSDKEAIREGKSSGICDTEYDVLETGADNRDKVGVVSFTDGQYASLHDAFVRRSLPKSGVAIIRNSGGTEGHIETLCAEKGIVCLFPESCESKYTNILSFTHKIKYAHCDFYGQKKVRVISDGLKGKVYGVENTEE